MIIYKVQLSIIWLYLHCACKVALHFPPRLPQAGAKELQHLLPLDMLTKCADNLRQTTVLVLPSIHAVHFAILLVSKVRVGEHQGELSVWNILYPGKYSGCCYPGH